VPDRVQVDIPAAFAAGQIFAMLSREYLAGEKDLFTHRLAGPVAAYFSVMFTPPALFLLICWPAWESMYQWEWVEHPAMDPTVSFFYIGFYMSMVIIGCGSYVTAHSLYRRGKDLFVKAAAITGVIIAVLPFFIHPFTWYYVSTYARYHGVPRTTTTMFSNASFFFSWLAVMGFALISSVYFGMWLRKTSCILRRGY
jgi:hypothetical protein